MARSGAGRGDLGPSERGGLGRRRRTVRTSEIRLGAVHAVQTLVQGPHHLGASETFETGADVLVVPVQGSDFQHPARTQE